MKYQIVTTSGSGSKESKSKEQSARLLIRRTTSGHKGKVKTMHDLQVDQRYICLSTFTKGLSPPLARPSFARYRCFQSPRPRETLLRIAAVNAASSGCVYISFSQAHANFSRASRVPHTAGTTSTAACAYQRPVSAGCQARVPRTTPRCSPLC